MIIWLAVVVVFLSVTSILMQIQLVLARATLKQVRDSEEFAWGVIRELSIFPGTERPDLVLRAVAEALRHVSEKDLQEKQKRSAP